MAAPLELEYYLIDSEDLENRNIDINVLCDEPQEEQNGDEEVLAPFDEFKLCQEPSKFICTWIRSI